MKKTIKDSDRILLILESPNKVVTFRQFLPSNYVCMASVGHITRLADVGKYNLGIDVNNNFKPTYEIPKEKKEVVSKLKEQVKLADKVILFTDGDREGEAIAYHLKSELKIPETKYMRCTVHEITKKAVIEALANPRKLDLDLIAAAIARESLDKMIGYILTQVLRRAIGAWSVGRCQTAGLLIIVEREEEIENFKPEKYFNLYLNFEKNNTKFTANYIGTDKKQIKSFDSLEQCKKVVAECKKNGQYSILDVTHKDSMENPKPPFNTSTFQQEVSSKMGLGVKDAMSCAQKLFEGISLNGKHVALITYLRTDDTTMSPEFVETLKDYVKTNYGEEYYASVKAGKKDPKSQDGHEALRCIDLNLTPSELSKYISDSRLIKVYTIIYNRTLASSMKPAIIANTVYTIENGNHRFSMVSKELKFDGYRKIYNYDKIDDEKDAVIKETFKKGEILKNTKLEAAEKETKPLPRFTEASFVKELDRLGEGRPSTYAYILSTILDTKRGFCKLEDKKIVPQQMGRTLINYVRKNLSDIFNIQYTAEMEKGLDLISTGKLNGIDFLDDNYKKLMTDINKISPEMVEAGTRVCPKCGKPLVIRRGKYGLFYGCSGYPNCNFLESLKKKAQ